MAGRQQVRHKGLYDRRCKGVAIGIGDLVLVKKTAWKGRHKLQDRWESDEYQVIGQPNPGIPVYEVKKCCRTGSGFCIQPIAAPARETQATRWAGGGRPPRP